MKETWKHQTPAWPCTFVTSRPVGMGGRWHAVVTSTAGDCCTMYHRLMRPEGQALGWGARWEPVAGCVANRLAGGPLATPWIRS